MTAHPEDVLLFVEASCGYDWGTKCEWPCERCTHQAALFFQRLDSARATRLPAEVRALVADFKAMGTARWDTIADTLWSQQMVLEDALDKMEIASEE